MKLIALNIFVACFLVIKPCLSTEDKSNSFLCPDSSGTSLVTTVVSGCKVYYTCENAVVTKIFQCSESPILAGTTHVCHENPQCPGIDSFEEFINLPTLEESKISKSAASVVATNDNKGKLPAFVNTITSFVKCLVNVDNIDGFCKTCIDNSLFQKKPFLEIEFSPKVFDVFSKVLNKSKSLEDHKHDPNWDTTFGKVLKDFIRYLSPRCELVCKDVSKQPEHSYEDRSQSEQHISVEDLKQSSYDGNVPDQVLSGNRLRRSPISVFSLMSVLMNRTQVQFPNPTVAPPTTPDSVEDVNATLMSNVIVPIIQDIVNDEEALRNATDLFRIVFEALVPLATEILESSDEAFDYNRKPILKIPRKMVQSTIQKISVDGYPILRSLLLSKMPPFLMLLSRNTKLLFRSWDEMESRFEPNVRDAISKGFELYRKYYGMFRSSSADFIHTYPLIEIQQDIESLYSLLPEVSRELVLNNWSVFQDASGITTESISKMLLDIPGIFDAINAVPFETYVYFLLLLI